jgi:hypothetical protein
MSKLMGNREIISCIRIIVKTRLHQHISSKILFWFLFGLGSVSSAHGHVEGRGVGHLGLVGGVPSPGRGRVGEEEILS